MRRGRAPRRRSIFRFLGVIALGLVGGLAVVVAASFLIGGPAFTLRSVREMVHPDGETFGHRFERSGLARWWRCRGVERPTLATTTKPWELHYSWTGGYGEGDVFLDLRSDGRAALSVKRDRVPETAPREVTVPSEVVAAVAEEIDRTGFLCLTPIPRADHHVIDLGRYTVRVTSTGYAKEVWAGACDYVEDPDSFDNVLDAIYRLEPVFGERISLGPFGITTAAGPCGERGS